MAIGPKEAAMRAQRAARAAAAEKSSRGGTVKARAGAVDLPVANEHRGPKGRGGALERSLDRLDVNRASGEPNRQPHHLTAGAAPGPRETKPKRGRPRIEDRDKPKPQKPWVAAGMSRRTWFRREAERRQKEAK